MGRPMREMGLAKHPLRRPCVTDARFDDKSSIGQVGLVINKAAELVKPSMPTPFLLLDAIDSDPVDVTSASSLSRLVTLMNLPSRADSRNDALLNQAMELYAEDPPLYGERHETLRKPSMLSDIAWKQGYGSVLATSRLRWSGLGLIPPHLTEPKVVGSLTYRCLVSEGTLFVEVMMLRVSAPGCGIGSHLIEKLKADLLQAVRSLQPRRAERTAETAPVSEGTAETADDSEGVAETDDVTEPDKAAVEAAETTAETTAETEEAAAGASDSAEVSGASDPKKPSSDPQPLIERVVLLAHAWGGVGLKDKRLARFYERNGLVDDPAAQGTMKW